MTGNLTIGKGYTVEVHNSEGSGIRANTDGKVTTNADINVYDSAGGSAIIAKNVSAIANSGKIISASTTAPVIDASGDSNKNHQYRYPSGYQRYSSGDSIWQGQ